MQSAALASSASAVLLLGLKAWAAWATGSVSMLGSLADTALDLFASLLTLFAVGLASQPADDDHKFGHGKAEAIAALMQTLLIVGSAAVIMWRAILAMGQTELPRAPQVGIGVSVAAIALTMALIAWQRHVVKQTGSIAIATDSLHYQSDLLLNLTVIAALVLDIYLGIHGADAVLGIIISLWIAWSALTSAREAIDMLMDREWPPEKSARLAAIALAVPGVESVHNLRTRSSGVTDFIQFHIWLDPLLTVQVAHDIVDSVEAQLHSVFADAEFFIHIDPRGHIDPLPPKSFERG
ncbi:iron transporter [Polymorphobacter glacialis]|uniref:Iron transporter n=1 Tax=Sandarakinorhabdus glacialis TaxID=1614636 RepID=A0A916ZQP1_9SPHN|nr:iron transporter [Polymorphobacter glacialis]